MKVRSSKALWHLVKNDVLLRTGHFSMMRRRLQLLNEGLTAECDVTTAHQVHRAVIQAAGLYPCVSPCLVPSITTALLIRLHKVAGSEVVIGVKRYSAAARFGVRGTALDVDGHAWIEVHNQPVGDDPDSIEQYQVIDRF